MPADHPDEPGGPRGRRWRPHVALQVRLRYVDLGSPPCAVARAAALLSPAERRLADRGTAAVRRRRILLRSALRAELGAQLGVPAADVPLAPGPGRPRWAAHPAPDLDMSCSASGSVGLLAVVRGARVGVDVQRCGPEDLEAARAEGWLADAELDTIAGLPEPERAVALARCWVAKEAVLKGRGVGLLADPATVQTAGRSSVDGWQLRPVPAPAGHVAAVAVRQRSRLPRRVVVHVAHGGGA